jgi:uncharacterized protein (DUF2236 family)
LSTPARSGDALNGVAWRLNAERLVLLGWSRAVLLQLAHPLVAAGVSDHSSFRAGVVTAATRLRHTVRAMLSLTFGNEGERAATLARISGIHRTVNGVLKEGVGPYPLFRRGPRTPHPWVHCTLLESIPLVYERLVGPISIGDRDQYCVEAEPIVRALGVGGEVPRSWDAVQQHLTDRYASGRIVVGAPARELAAAVLAPPLAGLVAPVTRLNRLVTVSLLPPPIRQQYGLAWNERDERSLERWTDRVRRVRHALPDRLTLWPEARTVVE